MCRLRRRFIISSGWCVSLKVRAVGTMNGRAIRDKHGKSWGGALAQCSNCGSDHELDSQVNLIDMDGVGLDGFDHWFCESCARARNLIW